MDINVKDTGLTYNFQISEGKFAFESGSEKKRMDLLFFMSFDFTQRRYRPDFFPGLSWIIQKPMSYVRNVRTLLLGQFKGKVLTNIQNIEIKSLDIGKSRSEKSYYLALDYAYKYDVVKEDKEFVKIL